MPSSREQIDALTGLRGIAAGWVMLMHFREITPTRVWHFPVLDTLIANGAYGVDIFFVLSGFILCHVYMGTFRNGLAVDRIRKFMVYRFARLDPVHLVTFFIMLALLTAKLMMSGSSGVPERYDAVTILSTLLLVHAWIPSVQTPNMPAWSISAEWFAYILFPVLCFALARHRWSAALFAAMGLGLAFFQPFGHYPLSHVMSGFLVGMAAYRVLPLLQRVTPGALAGPIFAAAIVFWGYRPDPPIATGLLLFALLIVALADSKDLLGRVLALPVLIYLGEISYSIYMVHWPARVIVRNAFQMTGLLDRSAPALIVSVFVAVTLIGAVVSYHFVELPGRTLLRRALIRVPRMAGVASAAVEPR
jgi:peptidoglycan/LPS O-acetylase OafA/YrhL